MRRARAIAAAAAVGILLGGCADEGSPGESSTSSTESTTSDPSSESTSSPTGYKAEAVEAARAWIEDDAGRLTAQNATPKQVAEGQQFDRALKKAGITTKGHDSVVSAEIDKGLTNTTDVVITMCVITDQRLMKGGKNVRTDAQGKAIKPGDRLLQTVEMHRDVGEEDWLVSGGRVRETPC